MTAKNLRKVSCRASELAEICGISPRHVSRLSDKGVFTRAGYNQYLVVDSVERYIAYYNDTHRDSLQESATDDIKSLDEEKAMHEHVKIKMDEIRLALMRSHIHEASHVKMCMDYMHDAIRERVRRIPVDVSGQLVGCSKAQIKEILETEIREALEELSNYEFPEDFGA